MFSKIREILQKKYFKKNIPSKPAFQIPIPISEYEKILILYTNENHFKNLIPAFKSVLEEFTSKKIDLFAPKFTDDQVNFKGFPKQEFLPSLPFDRKTLIFNFGNSHPVILYLVSKFKDRFVVSFEENDMLHQYSNLIIKIQRTQNKDDFKQVLSQIFIVCS
jgi:hypothetical protein